MRLKTSKLRATLPVALASWRHAAELLPQDTRQYTIIAGHIARLGRLAEKQPSPGGRSAASQATPARQASPSRWSGGVISGMIGTVALAVWKFKFLAVALATKGKLLLLGLTKASTFFTMFASLGLYWTVFGGWLAVGLVLSIYVHEMGHVFALMRYGVKASAPLFIPGLGAVVLLKQSLVDPKQDARVGLAGPIWGTAAALFCAGVYQLTGVPIWAAIAQLGAFINLFNLLPFWQLDGGRAFRSLNKAQRAGWRWRPSPLRGPSPTRGSWCCCSPAESGTQSLTSPPKVRTRRSSPSTQFW